MTPERDDVVFVAVNLDPFATHSALVELPLWELGISEDQLYRLHERLTDTRQEWRGRGGRVTPDPQHEPAAVFILPRRGVRAQEGEEAGALEVKPAREPPPVA